MVWIRRRVDAPSSHQCARSRLWLRRRIPRRCSRGGTTGSALHAAQRAIWWAASWNGDSGELPGGRFTREAAATTRCRATRRRGGRAAAAAGIFRGFSRHGSRALRRLLVAGLSDPVCGRVHATEHAPRVRSMSTVSPAEIGRDNGSLAASANSTSNGALTLLSPRTRRATGIIGVAVPWLPRSARFGDFVVVGC